MVGKRDNKRQKAERERKAKSLQAPVSPCSPPSKPQTGSNLLDFGAPEPSGCYDAKVCHGRLPQEVQGHSRGASRQVIWSQRVRGWLGSRATSGGKREGSGKPKASNHRYFQVVPHLSLIESQPGLGSGLRSPGSVSRCCRGESPWQGPKLWRGAGGWERGDQKVRDIGKGDDT